MMIRDPSLGCRAAPPSSVRAVECPRGASAIARVIHSLLDGVAILDSDPGPEVRAVLETPYDILVIIWGLVFIIAWVAFIAAMNHIFQTEERIWQQRDATSDASSGVSQHHPLHPTA